MEKAYISIAAAHGHIWEVRGNDRGVTWIAPEMLQQPFEENEITKYAAAQLLEYFHGNRTVFDFPMDLSGTPFQKEVWAALVEIPYGTTVSYGEVAAKIGRPKAVRAVGQAVGKNPCMIAVPCHRVIGKDGSLTGFSVGLDWKRYLLGLEQK